MSEISFKTVEGEEKFRTIYDLNLAMWPVDYETRYITTKFGKTHIIISGPKDAPPLILLHGFGFGSTMWYANIGELSKHYRTYAVDIPCDMNKSVSTKPFENKRECAMWLSMLLDELELEKVSMIGHSAGGWQTINFAIHHQNRLEKMVLLAPAASFIPFKKQFFIRLFSIMLFPLRRNVINAFCKWFVAPGNHVHEGLYEQFYVGLKNYKFKKVITPSVFSDEELSSIKIPTYLLVGDKEVIYNPVSAINSAKEKVQHIETKMVHLAGHALSIEKFDEVNSLIISFLRSK